MTSSVVDLRVNEINIQELSEKCCLSLWARRFPHLVAALRDVLEGLENPRHAQSY